MMIENTKTGIKIGAMDLSPARKKPCLIVQGRHNVTKYASFNNDMAAFEFMEILAKFVNAKE